MIGFVAVVLVVATALVVGGVVLASRAWTTDETTDDQTGHAATPVSTGEPHGLVDIDREDHAA